ncbi:hypothetical protein EN35_05120 [Rhodococcus qingshengii]|nr:hypothetical protein EN35_05120 [Rhodococcus qingshengii]
MNENWTVRCMIRNIFGDLIGVLSGAKIYVPSPRRSSVWPFKDEIGNIRMIEMLSADNFDRFISSAK